LALRGRALEWFHSIPARGGNSSDWAYIQGLFIVEFVLDDDEWLSHADRRYYHTSGRNPPANPSPRLSLLTNDLAWLQKPPPKGSTAEAFNGSTGIHRLSQLRELLNLIHDQQLKIPNPDSVEKKLDRDPFGHHWKPPRFDPTPDELLQSIYKSLLQMQHQVFPRREFPRLCKMPNFKAALLRDPNRLPISSPRTPFRKPRPDNGKTRQTTPQPHTITESTQTKTVLPLLNWDPDKELKYTTKNWLTTTTDNCDSIQFNSWKPWNNRLQISPLLGFAKTYV
jgi:hypothetical protein